MDMDRQEFWERVYSTRGEAEVSWFQESPAISMELLAGAGIGKSEAVIDIGGGASRLVDGLVSAGFEDVTILDLSQSALDHARARLGAAAAGVSWIVADVVSWKPPRRFDVWHDRAAFHFLTSGDDQNAYLAGLAEGLRPGGHAIIGTFAPDGPERCSGLPVIRYDARGLAERLGDGFELMAERRHDHVTPWNAVQKFQFCTFRRRSD